MSGVIHSVALSEAQYAAGTSSSIHIDYHDKDFPVFEATSTQEIGEHRLTKHLRQNLRFHGYQLHLDGVAHGEHIECYGQNLYVQDNRPRVRVMIQALPAKRVTDDMHPIQSKLQGDHHLLAHPPERQLAYHESRVAALTPFIENWYTDRHRDYILACEDTAETTQALFLAGMLQRSNTNPHEYRPTVAGFQWYRRAVHYLDNLPKQQVMFGDQHHEAAYIIW